MIMDLDHTSEDGFVYCSFQDIGILLSSKRFYKCLKPDVCCETGCCSSQGYKIGAIWQYWILLVLCGVICVSLVRFCCFLFLRSPTTPNRSQNNPNSTTRPYPNPHLNHDPVPVHRTVVGNRRPTSAINDGLTARDRLRGTTNDGIIGIDGSTMDGISVLGPLGQQWSRRGSRSGQMIPLDATGEGRRNSTGLTEEEFLMLGMFCPSSGLTRASQRSERLLGNNSTDATGDNMTLLSRLIDLSSADILYHSDLASNNLEKPPDYEELSHVKPEVVDDCELPSYDYAMFQLSATTIPAGNDSSAANASVAIDIDDNDISHVPNHNTDCQSNGNRQSHNV